MRAVNAACRSNFSPNPRNPRRNLDAELDELAASIRERGIVQPIVVAAGAAAPIVSRSSLASGAGARRSARGLHQVPIVALEASDSEALSLAIIENVQRADLNPPEEAAGYQALANEYHHSQEDIAKVVGKSRSHVANALRLLKLPETVKAYINAGKITAGAARMLIEPSDRSRWRARSSIAGSTSARSRRWRRNGRKGRAGRPSRAGQRCRHPRAREAIVRCARACGHDRSPRQRRRGEHPLSQCRAARRGGAAAGAQLIRIASATITPG